MVDMKPDRRVVVMQPGERAMGMQDTKA